MFKPSSHFYELLFITISTSFFGYLTKDIFPFASVLIAIVSFYGFKAVHFIYCKIIEINNSYERAIKCLNVVEKLLTANELMPFAEIFSKIAISAISTYFNIPNSSTNKNNTSSKKFFNKKSNSNSESESEFGNEYTNYYNSHKSMPDFEEKGFTFKKSHKFDNNMNMPNNNKKQNNDELNKNNSTYNDDATFEVKI